MDFFLVFFGLGFTIGLIIMTNYANKKLPKEEANKEPCPPHLWGYNKEDKMQCSKCYQLAGLVKTDNGEY